MAPLPAPTAQSSVFACTRGKSEEIVGRRAFMLAKVGVEGSNPFARSNNSKYLPGYAPQAPHSPEAGRKQMPKIGVLQSLSNTPR